jgi:RNA polymerase sigma-54 factor
LSAGALRDRLAKLVAEEDPDAPLSDEALAAALADGGGPIARRTVAKYRTMLNLPPAHRRRRRH